MKKLLWLLVTVLVVLAGIVFGGPYVTVHGLSRAIEQRDTARLDRYVDFPMLRANLRAQLSDYVVRRAGPDMQSSLFGALLEGHTLWKRASNDLDSPSNDAYAAPRPARPLNGATHHFESLSRFTATTHTPQGAPVVFILQRSGLRWRLVDIRLPLNPESTAPSVLPIQ